MQLQPLAQALRAELLCHPVLHADETPVAMLKPGAGKSYDPLKDFEAVSMIATIPMILVVRPGLPVNSVRELIDYARNNPGKLTIASSGTGSI